MLVRMAECPVACLDRARPGVPGTARRLLRWRPSIVELAGDDALDQITLPCRCLCVLREKFKLRGQHLSETIPNRAPPATAKSQATLKPVRLVPGMTYNHFRWTSGDAA